MHQCTLYKRFLPAPQSDRYGWFGNIYPMHFCKMRTMWDTGIRNGQQKFATYMHVSMCACASKRDIPFRDHRHTTFPSSEPGELRWKRWDWMQWPEDHKNLWEIRWSLIVHVGQHTAWRNKMIKGKWCGRFFGMQIKIDFRAAIVFSCYVWQHLGKNHKICGIFWFFKWMRFTFVIGSQGIVQRNTSTAFLKTLGLVYTLIKAEPPKNMLSRLKPIESQPEK